MSNALGNFIPEIWSKKLLAITKENDINPVNIICNRSWEGEIKQGGDTVHIREFLPNSVNIGTGVQVNYSDLGSEDNLLLIDKTKNFSIKVNDIEKAQQDINSLDGYASIAGQKVMDEIGQEIYNLHTDVASANKIGTVTAPLDVDESNAYGVFVDLMRKLKKSKAVTSTGFYQVEGNTTETIETKSPFAIVDTATEAVLMKTPEFTRAVESADVVIKDGIIGKIAGFTIYCDSYLDTLATSVISNNTGDAGLVICGTKTAVTFADQLEKVEGLRLQDEFADAIRGLWIYGHKLLHDDFLAVAYLDVATS